MTLFAASFARHWAERGKSVEWIVAELAARDCDVTAIDVIAHLLAVSTLREIRHVARKELPPLRLRD